MIESGLNILTRIHQRWQLRLAGEILLYAIGPAVLAYVLTSNFFQALITFIIVILITSVIIKPWKYSVSAVTTFLDAKFPALEHSTSLLLKDQEQLSPLARLQYEKVNQELGRTTKGLGPDRNMNSAMVMLILFLAGAMLINFFGLQKNFRLSDQEMQEQPIIFSSTDSTLSTSAQPVLTNQSIKISYPRYTRKASEELESMNLKALKGSVISWVLAFDKEVSQVSLQLKGEDMDMNLLDGTYQLSYELETSGFYNFKFIDKAGKAYYSELYSMEAVEDKSPEIEISGLQQFTSFDIDQIKKLNFKALVSDDYGVSKAIIIATVSKGSGESVKFREEQLEFDNNIPDQSKTVVLNKSIDLDKMQMSPGDELYFYVEATDVKRPDPNISKGETYFANIRDTVSDVFEVDGSMGVDQMPDYFRSQRQLIIDTEQLIKDKSSLSKEEFNSKSNELAFDQKALRIKYGEFMGDESSMPMETAEEAHEGEEENILAEYEHAHDTENESNLVEESHEDHEDHEDHDEGEETEEDPLHDYMHNHDDPEEATLYTKSLKAQLRMALNEMWDAELHLRLYHPEESLPVQYRILKRLQDIKNSARIYVHRIGFDPPPIKEDKRLSGDLKEVNNYKKSENLEKPDLYQAVKASVARLEVLIQKPELKTENDRLLFEAAGNEIGVLAIEKPGEYLATLQGLKKLAQGFRMSATDMLEIQRGLINALPQELSYPEKRDAYNDELNTIFMQELKTND